MSTNKPSKNLPTFEVCDICRKHVPLTTCEHGYPQSHLYGVELPMRYEHEIDNDGGVLYDVCEECVRAIYATLEARGLVL